MIATANSTTPTRIAGLAAFFIAEIILALFITDTEAEKTIIYGAMEAKFIEGKKLNLDVGLN